MLGITAMSRAHFGNEGGELGARRKHQLLWTHPLSIKIIGWIRIDHFVFDGNINNVLEECEGAVIA